MLLEPGSTPQKQAGREAAVIILGAEGLLGLEAYALGINTLWESTVSQRITASLVGLFQIHVRPFSA